MSSSFLNGSDELLVCGERSFNVWVPVPAIVSHICKVDRSELGFRSESEASEMPSIQEMIVDRNAMRWFVAFLECSDDRVKRSRRVVVVVLDVVVDVARVVLLDSSFHDVLIHFVSFRIAIRNGARFRPADERQRVLEIVRITDSNILESRVDGLCEQVEHI